MNGDSDERSNSGAINIECTFDVESCGVIHVHSLLFDSVPHTRDIRKTRAGVITRAVDRETLPDELSRTEYEARARGQKAPLHALPHSISTPITHAATATYDVFDSCPHDVST